MFSDYYETLQVAVSADVEVIKAAYKKLAMKYHPDTGGHNASSEKMKLLNEAYETLSDEISRRAYDVVRLNHYRQGMQEEKLQQVAKLIDAKRYFEAKAILEMMEGTVAKNWLSKINELIEQKSAESNDAVNKAKNSQPIKTSATPEEMVANEVNKVMEKKQQKEKQISDVRKREIENEKREIQEREMQIALYNKLGVNAFQWNGDKNTYNGVGATKLITWECIKLQRYETAKIHLDHLRRLKVSDKDIRNWSTIIAYILKNEPTRKKFKRLGIAGMFDYPIKFAGYIDNVVVWMCFAMSFCLFCSAFIKENNGLLHILAAGVLFWIAVTFGSDLLKSEKRYGKPVNV